MSLLFAEVLLVWHATNYLLCADPTRSRRCDGSSHRATRRLVWFLLRAACAAALTLVVAGLWPGMLLAGLMVVGCIFLPIARWMWVPAGYVAELELTANLSFAAVAQALVAHFDLHARWAPFRTAAPESLLSAYMISIALLIFVLRGGTLIVRGVLDRAGTMPPPEMEQRSSPPRPGAPELQGALPVDSIELNHGRLIGNVERLVLVLFVANGQYTALAFFFAAKGLIRSKDVERRAWADYLILGSLTSFLVAIVAGLLIQAVFRSATS